MIFDPLVLDPATLQLWSDFQSDRRLPMQLPAVVSHWERARALGADPDGPRPEDALLRGDILQERKERLADVLACGQSLLDRISSAAARNNFSLLLADTDGVIVHAAGGGQFTDNARRVRLFEGAIWDEQTRGTNAIGTALAEKRPVFVYGRAHYARGYHGLVCYAAPVHDASGELVAILDATSHVERDDASMGFAVMATAQALEELLRARAYSLAGATVTRALARSLERMDCPVVVIEPPGHVSRMNIPARELFSGANAQTTLGSLFGMGFGELSSRANSAHESEVISHTPRGPSGVQLVPIESAGRMIAILAFFEPLNSRQSSPRIKLARTIETSSTSEASNPFSELFCRDPQLQDTLQRVERIAASHVPVMLLAETGAGKELVARGIHRASRQAKSPFIAINCGSISPSLLESELFGYAPGAFTGAERGGRQGYLQAADGGTLFLDEVAEMSLAMQASILRFLENGTFQRVGETQTRQANVRIVCATCRNLSQMVQEGTFRRDLFYRLKGASFTLPPLRARKDVRQLADYLLRAAARHSEVVPAPTISTDAHRFIEAYEWPGNVRELKSTLEVALVMADNHNTIELEHLPVDMHSVIVSVLSAPQLTSTEQANESGVLQDTEARTVRRVLAEAGGNVSRAAARLGVARSTLYRMMRRHGVN